ncbi:MAG TPA: universal stress protein [Nitrospirota bacterium]|nr:universal stress protein [Nitrospirota bacterium]
MYTSIVVGYDESVPSKAALKEVSLRIKRSSGMIYLVNAVYFDQEEFVILPSQKEKRFEIGTHVCLEAKKNLHDEFGLDGNVDSIICEGEPPEVIIGIARSKKADLIALGTYGRKGLKRLLMGSVTSQVVLNAPCDVLVVKKPCADCAGAYHSLLVPFDGSESSKKALGRACELSKTDRSELSVLYVIPRYEEMMDFFKTESVKKSLYQEAEKIIEVAKKMAAGQGVEIKAVVQEGHAADKVVEIADKMKHDLIIVGTHGWRGVNKAIMGSTAERIIAHASCPVLIAK